MNGEPTRELVAYVAAGVAALGALVCALVGFFAATPDSLWWTRDGWYVVLGAAVALLVISDALERVGRRWARRRRASDEGGNCE